jgi:hypothetical protein
MFSPREEVCLADSLMTITPDLQGMEIFAALATVVSVAIALFRLSSWRRRNQLIYIDMNTLWT